MGRKGAPGNFEGWFGILEACRKLGKNGAVITSERLNDEMNFRETDEATPLQIASAWLGKFAKWGYVERGESDKSKVGLRGGRPPSTYTMSKLGNTCPDRPGRLTRLLQHVEALRAARGTPDENQIYQDLFILADIIKKNDEKER